MTGDEVKSVDIDEMREWLKKINKQGYGIHPSVAVEILDDLECTRGHYKALLEKYNILAARIVEIDEKLAGLDLS